MATAAAVPYIETLLRRVVARGGNMGIRFETDAPVRVTDGNSPPRDVTTRPFSAQEIMSTVAPIVPEDVKAQLHLHAEIAFDYVCAGLGVFTVMVRRQGEQVTGSEAWAEARRLSELLRTEYEAAAVDSGDDAVSGRPTADTVP